MAIKPCLQRAIIGYGAFCLGCPEKFHLGAQPPPDDRVIGLQPETQSLAIIDLFLDMLADQPVDFRRRRWPAPDLRELFCQPLRLVLANLDGAASGIDRLAAPRGKGEHSQSGKQEMG